MNRSVEEYLHGIYQHLIDKAIVRLQQTNLRDVLKYLADIASQQGSPYQISIEDSVKENGFVLIEVEVAEEGIFVYLKRENEPSINVYKQYGSSVDVFKDGFWVESVIEAEEKERVAELKEKIARFTPLEQEKNNE